MLVKRKLVTHLQKMLKKFKVVSVTGPRQSGKTTMLKAAFPHYKYYNLERIDYRAMLLSDIMGFLNSVGPYIIFDEAQNVPELFSYIQVKVDESNITGQYILSGSQSFLLQNNIAQSLAGRVSINHLFPFAINEFKLLQTKKMNTLILNGFYPGIYDKKIASHDFYPSYLQTYIERDIRTLKAIENLAAFTRFLGLCAGRVGQILNITSLANDAGIAVNTAKAWLSLLEASFVIYLLQPYYNNFNKRLIKAPKLYFYDCGVVASLLKINSIEMIRNHYAYGALFENLIISEIIKRQFHSGKKPSVYYWRESNGTEIDCIIQQKPNKILALEIKAGETFNTDYIKNLKKLPENSHNTAIKKMVVFAGDTTIKIDNINIISWPDFSNTLSELF